MTLKVRESFFPLIWRHQALMANGWGCQNIIYTTHGEAVNLNGEVDIASAKKQCSKFTCSFEDLVLD
jgi:hypothetical protein